MLRNISHLNFIVHNQYINIYSGVIAEKFTEEISNNHKYLSPLRVFFFPCFNFNFSIHR